MGSVWKLSHDGRLELLLNDFHAHNVSLDKAGNLITAHGENNHTMVRLSQNGTIDTLYHTYNHSEFFGGNCTYSPLGEIVFGANKHLWRINKSGVKEKVSEHAFEWNQTVYADEQGNYYLPDIGDGSGKLYQIDAQGATSLLATNLITRLDRPHDPHADILMGMTKGPEGNLYIAELAGKRIIKVAKNKEPSTFYTSPGNWFPTGIDFFDGDAYILEYKEKGGNAGPRITKVDVSGIATLLFDYDQYEKGSTPTVAVPYDSNNSWWVYLLIGITLLFVWISLRKKPNYHRQ